MRSMATRRIVGLVSAAAVLGLVPLAAVTTNAAATHSDVVISEVYGGGGNSGATYTHDYIELFNRGDAPANLAGLSVQYASSAGTTWQVTALSGTLAPGQAFLVRQAQGAGGSGPLP